MNVTIKPGFLIILSLALNTTRIFAGDVSSLDSLGFQGASDVVNAKGFDTPWAAELILNRQDHIELQPEQAAKIHGKRRIFGLNLGKSLVQGSDLTLGMRYVDESAEFPDLDSNLGKRRTQQGVNMSLALRQNLLDQKHIQLAFIPYIEPGYGPQDSFSITSKTRLGFLLASSLDYRYLEMVTNFGYRYRPVEYYGHYRLSTEYNFSARMGLKLNPVLLHGEIHERNIFVLSTMTRRPAYYRIVSQYHKIIASLDFDDLRYGLFLGRALHQKTFGMPGKQIGVSVTWNIRQNSGQHRYPETSPGSREVLPELPEYQEIPIDEAAPIFPFDSEDDLDNQRPQEEEPAFPGSTPFEIPELDQLEDRLQQMHLAEEQRAMPRLHESELYELQLGEAQIQRLNRVNQALEEKAALNQIRKKMHDKHLKPANALEQSDSNTQLLEKLDERADQASD